MTKPGTPPEAAEFALPLLRDKDISAAHLTGVCRDLAASDPGLDVKLARLLPGRYDDPYGLRTAEILRLLAVLDAISPGARLVMAVAHLANHPDPRVASEAVLWIGRRRFNRDWIKRRVVSHDAGVRANLVESMWAHRSPFTVNILRRCLKDDNARVVVNALLGLHLNGEAGIHRWARRLLRDARAEFRRSGAWLMAQVGDNAGLPILEKAKDDADATVRDEILKAIAKLSGPAVLAPPVPAPPEPRALKATRRWLPDFELRLDGRYVARRA